MVESDEWMGMNEWTNERRSRQNGKQNNNNNTYKMWCVRKCESECIKYDTRIKLQQFPNEKDWKYNDFEATKITYIYNVFEFERWAITAPRSRNDDDDNS